MKDKILNFLMVFLLVYLTFSLFAWKQDEKKLSNTISLSTVESYTVPASVKIEVKNETLTGFSFNTCNDFSIKKDSLTIKPEVCSDIMIKSWESYKVDFSKEFSRNSLVISNVSWFFVYSWQCPLTLRIRLLVSGRALLRTLKSACCGRYCQWHLD